MADTRTLRIVSVATFLPAFPLCLAHGVVSKSPTPAVGLVPLAFSAGVGVFLVLRQSKNKQPAKEPERGDGDVQEREQGPSNAQTSTQTHPILVFAVDTILATVLMIVLVFTWINANRGRANTVRTMLAAYATIPLLVNFFIHIYLAVRELSRGLAIPGQARYLAWQTVPPDCPGCGLRLRPDAPPRMPWLVEASLLSNSSSSQRSNNYFQNVLKLKLPAIPKMKTPAEWTGAPAWLGGRNRRDGYSALPTGPEDHGEIEESTVAAIIPYGDDPEVGETSVQAEEPETAEPEVVDVVGKKSRKLGRNSSSS